MCVSQFGLHTRWASRERKREIVGNSSPSIGSRGLDADSLVGIDALPLQSEASVSHRPTAATPWSYSPLRLDRMFPVEGQVSVATLPQESEAFPEQPNEWSRISNCVSPGATDATMSDRDSLCIGSASELSGSISDASMADPESSAPLDGPLAASVLPLSKHGTRTQ